MSICLSYTTNSKRQFATLIDLLRYRAVQQPNRTAFIFLQNGETESGRLTYQELDTKARKIAYQIRFKASAGERVLLLYPSGLDFITAFFGCLYAGVIAVPAYPPRVNQNLFRLQALVIDAQAKVALTTTPLLANLEPKWVESLEMPTVHWLATDNIDSNQGIEWQYPEEDNDALAFLQYTSGSTGKPKGVMVSHGNILHNLALIQKYFEHTPNSQGVIWLPPYHDMGLIGGVLQPIYSGFPVILMSPIDFLQKPVRWLMAISRYKATTSGGPNFAYDLCINKITPEQRASLDLSSWDVAFNGAEPIRRETLTEFTTTFYPCGFREEAFYPCYGMAETTLLVSGGLKAASPVIYSVDSVALTQNRVVKATDNSSNVRAIVSCGHTLLEQKVRIVDYETSCQCPPDRVGEIWVSSASVAQGYWNQPEQTKKTFQAVLADTGEGPFLRTGDLGFLHRGELFITGRLKDVIIIRGRNHYPQDIEQTVEQSHPSLRLGCGAAFAVQVDGEEKLVVVQEIERTALRQLDSEMVIGEIRRAIAKEHDLQVYGVQLLKPGSIPKTSSGKIQRGVCRSGFLDKSLTVVGEWLQNPQSQRNFLQQHPSVEENKSDNAICSKETACP